jgi:DNA polymerase-3 subunit delta'
MARTPVIQEIEGPPEADRLEGFTHPRETVMLFGHEAVERELAQMFAGGRMHHGWLISGPEGIGKATLAYRLAVHVLARGEDRDAGRASLGIDAAAPAARQVRALAHPGLLVIRRPYDAKAKRFTTAIPVEEVRRLKMFLGHTAGEGSWRAVIVDPADDMNASAANAILKSLEEPPARTIFLLISSAPGRLLATIRSRCRTLALGPLRPGPLRSAVGQALAAAGKPALGEAEIARLERIAGGSVRRMLVLATVDGLKLLDRVNAIVGQLPNVDWPALHGLSDELSLAAAEQRFETFFELLQARVHELVREWAREAGGRGTADRIIPGDQLAAVAAAWQEIDAARAEADALNLDRKALILDSVARLAAASRALTGLFRDGR